MLRHLVRRSKYSLMPYGVDFIEESIKQAKETILPEYAENFIVGNIVDISEDCIIAATGKTLKARILTRDPHIQKIREVKVIWI